MTIGKVDAAETFVLQKRLKKNEILQHQFSPISSSAESLCNEFDVLATAKIQLWKHVPKRNLHFR